MATPTFGKSVFINCPFDSDFAPILQAMLFCISYVGFQPRIATESNDAGANRLGRIVELIRDCRFSIHDLSRSEAREAGELFRLNMPFELGIDYGCRTFGKPQHRSKRFLVLDEKKYRYQATLSDLAGCDIAYHGGSYDVAIRKVRNWLVSEAGVRADGPRKIVNAYADFLEWHYERQLRLGFSEEDIQDYPTPELLSSMQKWFDLGRPLSSG
jgi:hypothetical protein